MLKQFLNSMYLSADELNTTQICRALKMTGPHDRLLDVGCWDGVNTLKWANAGSARKVFGIEPIAQAALKAKKSHITVSQIHADSIKWPFANNSFDCVISNQVIEHLTNLDVFFKQSSRVLKPGGYLIISTNNLSSWHNIGSLLFGWAPFDLTNTSNKIWSLGNPLSLHKGNHDSRGKSWKHKCIYTAAWLNDWCRLYSLKSRFTFGAGYYPLPGILGNIDKTHSALMTLVYQKHGL